MRAVGAGTRKCETTFVCLAMLSGEGIGMEAGEPVTMALVTGKMATAGLVGIEIKHDTGGGPDWMWGNAEREKGQMVLGL